MIQKIKFQGEDYVLIGGAITTPERFKNGIVSHAHLNSAGQIMQYGEQIGIKSDIEFLEEIENIKPTVNGFINLLSGRSWT